MARQILILFAFLLLIRLPFLNQAIQGDEGNYLAGAEHGQIDPLHPNHTRYVFLGDWVDMSGHPHPPLNVWCLALLLAVIGDIREVPFHAFYFLFSAIAVSAMWSLARRFSPRPLWASLLFLAVPAFVINGNSLETDIPFLAFWMAGVALFTRHAFGWAVVPLILAALTAFQAVFLTPILMVYAWLYARRSKLGWAVTLVAPATIGAWQLYEYFSTGQLPAAVLTGYLHTYGFQAWEAKLRNAAALAVHATWIVCPALLPAAFLISRKRRDSDTLFLLAWIILFFAGALVVFFAGSARYLLPIAPPVALLVSRLSRRWLLPGFVAQITLGLALAWVNYQHWDGYRQFAATLEREAASRRIWIAGEWRYYLEAEGGLPLVRGQAVRPGEVVVQSELAYPIAFTTGGGTLAPIARREIRSWLPLRLIGLDARSGYSTASKGLRPFDISNGPIDRVRADLVIESRPSLESFRMNAPEAERQIVSGVYELEGNLFRWMAKRAVLLLKVPPRPARFELVFNIPGPALARRVTISLDGVQIASKDFPGPGTYKMAALASPTQKDSVAVQIEVDRTFSVPGDRRELGIILSEVGFKE